MDTTVDNVVRLDDEWPHGLWVPDRRQIILRLGSMLENSITRYPL